MRCYVRSDTEPVSGAAPLKRTRCPRTLRRPLQEKLHPGARHLDAGGRTARCARTTRAGIGRGIRAGGGSRPRWSPLSRREVARRTRFDRSSPVRSDSAARSGGVAQWWGGSLRCCVRGVCTGRGASHSRAAAASPTPSRGQLGCCGSGSAAATWSLVSVGGSSGGVSGDTGAYPHARCRGAPSYTASPHRRKPLAGKASTGSG